nr:MAG TPA: hypothetical protein [Caudoviricetes sp.]
MGRRGFLPLPFLLVSYGLFVVFQKSLESFFIRLFIV